MKHDREYAGLLTIPAAMDRTMRFFRKYYSDLIRITLVTYGLFALAGAVLYFTGIINPLKEILLENNDMPWGVFIILLFFTLPTFWADLAIQWYLSARVRELPFTWWQAVKRSLNYRILYYLLMKILGSILAGIVSTLSALFILIPFIGFFVFTFCIITAYVIFVSLGPALIVEEKRNFLTAIGRNLSLSFRHFWVVAFGSFAGTFCITAFMIALYNLFGGVTALIISLLYGHSDFFLHETDIAGFIFNLTVILVPVTLAVFFIPLSSVYYGIVYFGLKSRESAWDLENELRLYEKEVTTAMETAGKT